jgi:hypothetical protein
MWSVCFACVFFGFLSGQMRRVMQMIDNKFKADGGFTLQGGIKDASYVLSWFLFPSPNPRPRASLLNPPCLPSSTQTHPPHGRGVLGTHASHRHRTPAPHCRSSQRRRSARLVQHGRRTADLGRSPAVHEAGEWADLGESWVEKGRNWLMESFFLAGPSADQVGAI